VDIPSPEGDNSKRVKKLKNLTFLNNQPANFNQA
jgi:hypothetical protein